MCFDIFSFSSFPGFTKGVRFGQVFLLSERHRFKTLVSEMSATSMGFQKGDLAKSKLTQTKGFSVSRFPLKIILPPYILCLKHSVVDT